MSLSSLLRQFLSLPYSPSRPSLSFHSLSPKNTIAVIKPFIHFPCLPLYFFSFPFFLFRPFLFPVFPLGLPYPSIRLPLKTRFKLLSRSFPFLVFLSISSPFPFYYVHYFLFPIFPLGHSYSFIPLPLLFFSSRHVSCCLSYVSCSQFIPFFLCLPFFLLSFPVILISYFRICFCLSCLYHVSIRLSYPPLPSSSTSFCLPFFLLLHCTSILVLPLLPFVFL